MVWKKKVKKDYTSGHKESKTPSSTIIFINSKKLYVGPCTRVTREEVPTIILNETPPSREDQIRIPIDDLSITPLSNVLLAALLASEILDRDGAVGVCCTGGCGRTGTVSIIAMMLQGLDPEKAAEKFYKARECGPETIDQRSLVALLGAIKKRYGVGEMKRFMRMIVRHNLEELPESIEVPGENITILLDPLEDKIETVHKIGRIRIPRKMLKYFIELGVPVQTHTIMPISAISREKLEELASKLDKAEADLLRALHKYYTDKDFAKEYEDIKQTLVSLNNKYKAEKLGGYGYEKLGGYSYYGGYGIRGYGPEDYYYYDYEYKEESGYKEKEKNEDYDVWYWRV